MGLDPARACRGSQGAGKDFRGGNPGSGAASTQTGISRIPRTAPNLIGVRLTACGQLEDITHGSTLYYAPAGLAKGTTKPYTLPDGSVVPFPASWNEAAVTYRATICGQYFFTE
jgi:hypothetical protein